MFYFSAIVRKGIGTAFYVFFFFVKRDEQNKPLKTVDTEIFYPNE